MEGLQETFAARLGTALQAPKAVSEPPFIATIAAARADKLSIWSFTQPSELMNQRTTIAMLIFLR
jgi:hypothetical protein